MKKDLQDLIEISKITGSDKSLVLGPFGNTSVKTDDGEYMYIKASGTNLADMTENSGWRKLRLADIRQVISDPKLAKADEIRRDEIVESAIMQSTCDDFPQSVKPSVESSFHALMGKYVIHLHPAAVLGFACCGDGKRLISELVEGVLWVPHAGFGIELALQVCGLSAQFEKSHGKRPQVFVFENHGLAVCSECKDEVLRLVREVVDTCKKEFGQPKGIVQAHLEQGAIDFARAAVSGNLGDVELRFYVDDNIRYLMGRDDIGYITSVGAVTYDELAVAGGAAVWIERLDEDYLRKAVSKAVEKSLVLPKGFMVKGLGLFVAGGDYELVSDFISSYLAVRAFAADHGGVIPANPCKYMRYVKLK